MESNVVSDVRYKEVHGNTVERSKDNMPLHGLCWTVMTYDWRSIIITHALTSLVAVSHTAGLLHLHSGRSTHCTGRACATALPQFTCMSVLCIAGVAYTTQCWGFHKCN